MTYKKQDSKKFIIDLDPTKTPVLYSDNIRITSDKNGLVLDIAQKVPGSNRALVVARVGLSIEHAKRLTNALAIQLVRRKGLVLRKNKVLN
jgi:hypothetical protein